MSDNNAVCCVCGAKFQDTEDNTYGVCSQKCSQLFEEWLGQEEKEEMAKAVLEKQYLLGCEGCISDKCEECSEHNQYEDDFLGKVPF